MTNDVKKPEIEVPEPQISRPKSHGLSWLLWLICFFALFYNLGGAPLFEPDEGRNAEKAREILLLNDWVTPHENFVPILDKPIFYYWLIAISYKVFGLSEWAARLPSVLAAICCLIIVYRFARVQLGYWESLWSPLVLVTGLEFFILSRIVILDMTLTFFTTVALSCFYSAANAGQESKRKLLCLIMYLALAAGTLVKGLIGLILPGMVFFFYLLFAKKWSALRKMYLVPGVLIYISLVAPWYLWSEQRNPGYLQYYFWEEHFSRYLSDEFNRSKAWYYFPLVLGVGFLPWSFILPLSIKNLIEDFDDKYLFLALWVCLPLLFFSFSESQLPQYILPIFPALALLIARAVGATIDHATVKRLRWLYLLFFVLGLLACYFAAGTISARLLPEEIRASVVENVWFILSCTVLLLILCVALPIANMKGYWKSQPEVYLSSCAVCAIFFILMGRLMEDAAPHRSARSLAQSSASYISPKSRVVFYDTYLRGLIYYLSLPQPIWLVAREGKKNLLGSPYVSRSFPAPAAGYGKVFLDFDEFGRAWQKAEVPLMVFLKAKNLSRFEEQLGMTVRELARVNEYILVARP